MEIRAKCRLDKETMKALAHVSVYKKRNPQKAVIVNVIIKIIPILLCVAELIAFKVDSTFIILLLLALLLLLGDCFFYFFLPRIQYQTLAKMKETKHEYIFYDDAVKVFSAGTEYNGEVTLEYSLFVKVYETSKYFFLFQTNNQVFVVDKSTVEGGTADDIRAVLTGAVNGKYIICKY